LNGIILYIDFYLINNIYLFSLDPALIRPGRVDYKQYIGPLTSYQIEHMLIRFYPELTRDKINQFLNEIKYSKEFSAAELQGFFMYNKDSIKDVFDNIKDLLSKT
jgi:chaperone BCS1